jgi:antirestriction protein ArdC
MAAKAKKSIYETVTETIIEALEKGLDGKWEIPWFSQSAPCNGASGRQYNGINVLLLMLERSLKGYSSNEWFSYKQAQDKGGFVRKGEKGTFIIFAKTVTKTVEEDGEKKKVTFPIFRGFSVFNRDQIEGLPVKEVTPTLSPEEKLTNVEMFIRQTGASIKTADMAFYRHDPDFIGIPSFTDFKSPEKYYSTLLHELAHWTGHKTRLNRKMKNPFGSEDYAKEELVAELSAAFLCTELGVQGELQHPEYIGHWIKVLKDDKKAIFEASSKAQKAVEYLKATSTLVTNEVVNTEARASA